jgi:hypothetical protein
MENGQQQDYSPRETVRAVTVPLLLITVGILFLLDYSGGPSVRQSWPVLLIVAGGFWASIHLFSR